MKYRITYLTYVNPNMAEIASVPLGDAGSKRAAQTGDVQEFYMFNIGRNTHPMDCLDYSYLGKMRYFTKIEVNLEVFALLHAIACDVASFLTQSS